MYRVQQMTNIWSERRYERARINTLFVRRRSAVDAFLANLYRVLTPAHALSLGGNELVSPTEMLLTASPRDVFIYCAAYLYAAFFARFEGGITFR